jgi:hypothetical protein
MRVKINVITQVQGSKFKVDELVKSRKVLFFVIPANPGSWSRAGAGIQFFSIGYIVSGLRFSPE